MKLYIDTSEQKSLTIKLNEETYTSDAKEKTSQLLLPFILEKLQEKNLSWEDITEIEINKGPGSYTGLRVGASIAQTLTWSLGLSSLQSIKLNY